MKMKNFGIQREKFEMEIMKHPRKVTLESNVARLLFRKFLCRLPQPSETRSRLHSLLIGMFRDWSREL